MLKKAVALDLAQKMLLLGEKKMVSQSYFAKVSFKVGSALDVPNGENAFDCATMAFGIRNTGNVEKTLSEIYRILKPRGQCLILEFSIPKNFFFKALYLAYFRYALPLLGGILTKNFSAYYYLNQSVEKFPQPKELLSLMQKQGFSRCSFHSLSWGICTLYLGYK